MLHTAVLFSAAALAVAAPAPADLSTTGTDEFVSLCARDRMACGNFVANVMEFLEAAAGFNEIQSYQVCAPNPFGDREIDAILGWIRANPDRARGVAADAIGAAGEILWPCR